MVWYSVTVVIFELTEINDFWHKFCEYDTEMLMWVVFVTSGGTTHKVAYLCSPSVTCDELFKEFSVFNTLDSLGDVNLSIISTQYLKKHEIIFVIDFILWVKKKIHL